MASQLIMSMTIISSDLMKSKTQKIWFNQRKNLTRSFLHRSNLLNLSPLLSSNFKRKKHQIVSHQRQLPLLLLLLLPLSSLNFLSLSKQEVHHREKKIQGSHRFRILSVFHRTKVQRKFKTVEFEI